MRSVRYSGPGQFSVVDVEERPLLPHELRLTVLASGVCGTDLFIHRNAGYGTTPGHEMVGAVIELGTSVDGWQVGDRVAVDNNVTCGACEMCHDGLGSLCVAIEGMGGSIPGSVAEHVIVDASKCISIGDLDVDTAVLAEPTACVVHGLDVLDMRPGSRVLVIGAGPTGQILSQLLTRGGASTVTIAGPSRAKLEIALRNGATAAVSTSRADFAASRGALLADHPSGYDIVVDATGQESVLQQCLPLLRSGGTFLVYGVAEAGATITVTPFEIFRRQLTIKGSFAQVNCVARAVALLAAGKVVTDGLITHRFGLDEYRAAVDAVTDPGCLKAVVYPNPPSVDGSSPRG